jgi:N-methylhydantoinase A
VPWSDVAQAVHGTTLGSNVVIERKARSVGLLTTRGFRDVLIIGREKRYQVYDLQIEKPGAADPAPADRRGHRAGHGGRRRAHAAR